MRDLKQVTVVKSVYSKSQLDHVLKCVDSLRKQVPTPKEILLVLDNDQGLVDFYPARVPGNVKIIARALEMWRKYETRLGEFNAE